MLKNKKESLRGKSEWREYFKGNGKHTNSKQKARVLQYVKKRAKICMEDLVLISKGLHYLTNGFESPEKAEKHRRDIFLMPLTARCFTRLYVETKGRIKDIKELFHEYGQEIVFDVRGYRVDALKKKKRLRRRS